MILETKKTRVEGNRRITVTTLHPEAAARDLVTRDIAEAKIYYQSICGGSSEGYSYRRFNDEIEIYKINGKVIPSQFYSYKKLVKEQLQRQGQSSIFDFLK